MQAGFLSLPDPSTLLFKSPTTSSPSFPTTSSLPPSLSNMSNLFLLLIFLDLLIALSLFSTILTPADGHLSTARKLVDTANVVGNDTLAPVHGSPVTKGLLVETRVRLPGLPKGVSVKQLGHHAGSYFLRRASALRIFYHFFESKRDEGDPVVLWLAGGPGLSSQQAVFYEHGPYRMVDNKSLALNVFSWDKASNIIFVDQPIGTGFSYTANSRMVHHDMKGVCADLYEFLQGFFTAHPKYAKNDFYIIGQGYAGHVVSALASQIQRENKANEGIHINLKGLAIGNGLVEPTVYYRSMVEYMSDNALIEKARSDSQVMYKRCKDAIKDCALGIGSCGDRDTACFIIEQLSLLGPNISTLDLRNKCFTEICFDIPILKEYLNQKAVQDVLGVRNVEFLHRRGSVMGALLQDTLISYAEPFPAFLEDGIKLLVFAGEFDPLFTWTGNYEWIQALKWSGQKEIKSSPVIPFVVDNANAGELRSHGPLSFMKIHNAGHLVGMDQPKASLEMLRRWFEGNLATGTE